MENIYAAFGEVDLDPCAHLLSPVNARRRILLSEGGNGLVDDWSGRVAFVNPPFSGLLALPREVRIVDALPVPGTGKLDYVTMTELVVAAPSGAVSANNVETAS